MEGFEDRLLTNCRKGDNDAFRQLVEHLGGRIYHLVLPMINNREDAKDIVQDAFLRAYEHMDSFRGASSLETWICSIALNAARDWLKKNKPITVPFDECTALAHQEHAIDDIARAETEVIIKNALAQLNAEFREMLILRDMMGFSYEEIAEMQHVELGTVKSRLSRARCAMRELLIREEGIL